MNTYIMVVALICGSYYYVSRHVHFHDSLAYAKKNPDPVWAPKIDYYVGMIYYRRSEYPLAQEAFTQLLTDYPTCQYAASALITLAGAAQENRDFKVARDALVRYVEEFPDGKDITVARKQLEIIKYRHGL